MFDSILIPLHRDGWKFVALFALVTLGLFFLWQPLGWLGVVLSCWCAYFFRDPPRVSPVGSNWVLESGRWAGLGGPACRAPAGDRPGRSGADADQYLHECVQCSCEPQSRRGRGRSTGLSARAFLQRLAGQGQRVQRADGYAPDHGSRARSGRGADRGAGGPADPLRCETGRPSASGGALRLDSLRQPPRCLSAATGWLPWLPSARPWWPERPCSPISLPAKRRAQRREHRWTSAIRAARRSTG